jgi:ketosteroid isomerase-like protein
MMSWCPAFEYTCGGSGSRNELSEEAMPRVHRIVLSAVLGLTVAVVASRAADPAALKGQVEDVERAFADTMAERDHDGFTTFLSEETIFFSGPTILRGKQQVADAWKSYFDGPAAPFSWEPETVEVNDSGTLALSSGPVRDPDGRLVATFTSIWKQEEPGVWRIVFDKGNRVCPPETPGTEPSPPEEPSDSGE